jgi:hypothetical protein
VNSIITLIILGPALSGLGWSPLLGCCEYSNLHSVSNTKRGIPDQVSDKEIPSKEATSCNCLYILIT